VEARDWGNLGKGAEAIEGVPMLHVANRDDTTRVRLRLLAAIEPASEPAPD